MITPSSLEEIASYVEQEGKKVFVFSADWCGDCRYLKPFLPEIEAENPEFTFILIDRDAYMDHSILSRIKIGEEHDCNIQQRTSRRCIDADLEK